MFRCFCKATRLERSVKSAAVAAAIFPKADSIVYIIVIASSNNDMILMMLVLLSDLASPTPTFVSVSLSYWYASIKWVLKLAHILSFAVLFFHLSIVAVNWAVLLMIFVVICRIRLPDIVSLPALEKVIL